MTAKLLDGKAVAAAIRATLPPAVAAICKARGRAPGMAIVTHTPEESAGAYMRAKLKACAEVGIWAQAYPCEAGADLDRMTKLISRLGSDPAIDGIIVEQPLPKSWDPAAVFSAIPPHKDVEGVNPVNYGRFFLAKSAAEIASSDITPPCTVAAIIALLRESGLHVPGKEAVVVGRSEIVGRPAAHFLTALDATVTLCHSQTQDLPGHLRRADIVVAGLGRAQFIRGSWLKPGAVVIDAGINRSQGAWVGDVNYAEACGTASFITPVPGGVGPVTTAVVLANTVKAAQRQAP
ncbi:MAG: bifunctional 5,10-methylenetetrahydrofolate dehydrogenase/5,10-methenyltetrahydrofolate cyclohydrolase [Elusimicrobiota bacterium]|jgi:methylenetetrahydrofolate dehydrogenase (NADP+)/methenyltetrahydrofolate cyclohydrolase